MKEFIFTAIVVKCSIFRRRDHRIYITTRSNDDTSSNNYGTTDRSWDKYSYNNSLAMFNSAGNSGGSTGSISTPGKGLNIVAVGNYNDATNGINTGSSFTDPNIGNDKPELSAPGTNITAGGFTMTGTSMSCPHSDGYVTTRIYISSSYKKARVALAWMNRGSFTYDHRNDAHAIGIDLDMKVYAPNGSFVGGTYSWDNSFEYVNFTPSTSGYYTVKINRYANRHTSSALRMGLYTNYYN